MANKKIIIPVVALMLCAVAFTGLGFAYQGTYSDSTNSTSINAHWVKVGSDAQISINLNNPKVDVDTSTVRNGSTVTVTNKFVSKQSELGLPERASYSVSTNGETLTLSHVKIGTLNIVASDNGEKSGILEVSISPSGAQNGVTVELDGTYDTFNITQNNKQTMDIYVNITISNSAISGSSVTIPQFSLDVKAEATHAAATSS